VLLCVGKISAAAGTIAISRSPVKLAYLTNQYPAPSHTFIRNEICALEKQGIPLARFSIRRASEPLLNPLDQAEAARTHFLLEHGALALLRNFFHAAFTRPRAFLFALRLACKIGWRSQRGLARHFVYLAEACLLQALCAERSITHLHVHHATNPAAVALLCRALGGPSYSITVHGPEEFEQAAPLALNEKIARAAFVVAVSVWGRNRLRQCCDSAQHHKIFVIRVGVDGRFVSAAPTHILNTTRLVWIGRLAEQKDPRLLIRAVEKLRAQNVSCAVTMLGDGPLRLDVEQEIARGGLQDAIQIKGWASAQEILAALRDARALVLTSRAENVPSVILEAMAQERVVLGPNVGGVAELVQDGKTGWLVPPNSVDALAAALRVVLETNVTELARMGKAGRQCVLENFDVAAQAEKLRALFTRVEAGN
jgi:glycosyltransferase involved in cell wall biosynthesis